MDHQTMVNFLIENACCWEEGDRPILANMGEDKLELFVANHLREVSLERRFERHARRRAKPPLGENTMSQDPAKVTANQDLTEDQYIATLPPAIREDVIYARSLKMQEKQNVINQLVANISDPSARQKHAERLANRPLEDLKQDLSLMPKMEKPQPTYVGQASPVGNYQREEDLDKDDILPLPTVNWKSA